MMGFISSFVRRLIKISVYLTIFLALIVLIPNIPPYTSFTSIPLDPTLPREGPLALNGDLNNAERVYVDKLLGPEAFTLYRGELYTSLSTGEIVKISPGGHVTFVTKIGQPCSGIIHEHICGRPLGIEIDEKNNVMYVADAYLGIWKVNLKDDKKQLLVSPNVPIKGRQPKLFNSVALAKNGDLYWTDSSSDFHLKDGAIATMVDPSGRLFHYNAATNKSEVLLDNLWFPNGVIISPDNHFVLVVETSRFRVMKYYVNGPKKGKSEVFVTGLPGAPDNIRSLPDGSGVLVALYTAFDDDNPLLVRSMAETPVVRKLVARIQRLIEIPFEYINSVYPHIVFEDIVYNIGNFKSMSSLVPKQAGLVYIDWDGNVISSHYNTDGTLGHISDAIVYNNRLYTGSPHLQNFIGSVPIPPALKKAFESNQKPVESPKPVETPKPERVKEAKPVEAAKPKPVEQKPTPKPVQQKATPKPEPPKVQPPKQEAKPTPKPEIRTTPPPTEKPQVKTTPTPTKPVKKTTPEVKTTTSKPQVKTTEKPKQDKKENVEAKPNKVVPQQIPITEEIPSDTAKPPKDKLKVIKKGGVPSEIPNPNV